MPEVATQNKNLVPFGGLFFLPIFPSCAQSRLAVISKRGKSGLTYVVEKGAKVIYDNTHFSQKSENGRLDKNKDSC